MLIKKEILFHASSEQVWKLLTAPEMTKQYMFGCEVLSDWEIGSSIRWKGHTEDGKEIVHVKGEITEIDKGKKVAFTMIDPNMGLEDIPENYLNLSYELKEVKEGTQVTLIQDGFSNAVNGKKRYDESMAGWDMVIGLMKKILD